MGNVLKKKGQVILVWAPSIIDRNTILQESDGMMLNRNTKVIQASKYPKGDKSYAKKKLKKEFVAAWDTADHHYGVQRSVVKMFISKGMNVMIGLSPTHIYDYIQSNQGDVRIIEISMDISEMKRKFLETGISEDLTCIKLHSVYINAQKLQAIISEGKYHRLPFNLTIQETIHDFVDMVEEMFVSRPVLSSTKSIGNVHDDYDQVAIQRDASLVSRTRNPTNYLKNGDRGEDVYALEEYIVPKKSGLFASSPDLRMRHHHEMRASKGLRRNKGRDSHYILE